MPRGRVRRALRRRYPFGRSRTRHKRTIPLEVVVAGVAIPFTPATEGWNTPMAYVQGGDYEGAMNALKQGFLGMQPDGSMDLMRTLNPFDFNTARYTKMLIAAGLVSKVRKRLVHIPLDKIPIVGRYIS